MRNGPFSGGGGCQRGIPGLTQLKIGAQGYVVGMAGLETIFKQLHALHRRPGEATGTELLGMARKFNYIPNQREVEADYVVALREAYRDFYARLEPMDERPTR